MRKPSIPVDPRVVGGRYWCSYWGKEYVVLAISPIVEPFRFVSVQWEDGTVTHHSTPWDKRDRIVLEETR